MFCVNKKKQTNIKNLKQKNLLLTLSRNKQRFYLNCIVDIYLSFTFKFPSLDHKLPQYHKLSTTQINTYLTNKSKNSLGHE